MSDIKVKQTLNKIMKKELQVCPARDIPPSQGILPLTQVKYLKKWRPTWFQVSESSRSTRYKPSSEHSHEANFIISYTNPRGVFQHVDLHNKTVRVSDHKETQEVDSTQHLSCQYIWILINIGCKGREYISGEFNSSTQPFRKMTNQVVESDKVSNSRSWNYLTELMLEVIRALEAGR